jgi:predicted nucleotidyltransferase
MPSPQLELHGIAIPMDQLAELCRRYHVRELALFGSVLRDDFRPDSDIDVLVEFEPGAPIGLLEYVGLQNALADLIGRNVDLVEKAGLKRLIRDSVINSARLLYAA